MTTPAESLQQRLRALFLEELDENVRLLNQGLLTLEAERGQGPGSSELLAGLFRAAHSLKGAAHAADMPTCVTISTRLEEQLGDLRDGTIDVTPVVLSALFADVDALVAEGRRSRIVEEDPGPDATTTDLFGAVDAGATRTVAVAPTLRVASSKIGRLLDHAADLRVSARRLASSGSEGRVAREQVVAATLDWRASHKTIVAAAERSGDEKLLAAAGCADRAWSVLRARLDELGVRTDAAARRFAVEANRVADATQALHMQPFGEVCEGLDRAVRDIAASAAKDVRFSLIGAELEIDRSVGASLREPVLHLLRNAVDHGIETPDQRRRSGKPPTGGIDVTVAVTEGGLEVTVRDDGAGVDITALQTAWHRQQGAMPEDHLELLFTPGLSTAKRVTAVSGRGVGLDAVRTRIEQLGGHVRVSSELGRGTEVLLSLPQTLSSMHAVLVEAAGETLAVPSSAAHRLISLQRSELREAEGRTFALVAGRHLPVVSLSAALALDGEPGQRDVIDTLHALVVPTGAGEMLVLVDALLEETEILLKALPRRARGLPGILGATLLADGRPALVVNPAACVRAASGAAHRIGLASSAASQVEPARILLVEDTVTTRVLEQSILEGAGYQVMVAADGAEAWRLLQEHGADLVVTDVNMPEMDGFELCTSIRSSPRFESLPVVLVTSLADDDDRRRGLEVGANAYLVKSAFDQHVLLGAVEQLL